MKNLMLISMLILSVAMTVFLVSPKAQASEDYAGNIGLSYGLSVPDQSGTTSRSILGFQGTAKLGSEWGLGGYYMTSSKSEGGIASDFNYQFYGVKGTYHFEGDARGVYFGVAAGISKVHMSNVDTSPTHFGVLAGYDKMLGDMFSIGGEFNYIAVGSSSTTYNGAPASIPSFNTLNFALTGKLWF